MHDTGCLGLVHWDDPEGWYGEGGGRRVQDGQRSLVGYIIVHALAKSLPRLSDEHLQTLFFDPDFQNSKHNKLVSFKPPSLW